MADKPLTVERSMADFKRAYRSKSKLIERQREDFLFRLGKQWDDAKYKEMKERKITPVTDNRIQPNIALLTGLERQNRSDFKAFPEGEEDSIKAEIATALFKNSIKMSDFGYKASEAFEDGVTCGESNLELYLDNTYNLLNGKPCWKKIDSNRLFQDPASREYDYSDAKYVYKLTTDICKEDLISLFQDKRDLIEAQDGGKIDLESIGSSSDVHRQPKDYPKQSDSSVGDEKEENPFDLIERYYKKWVEKSYVGDRQTGEIKEAETNDKAKSFVTDYQNGIAQEQQQYQMDQQQYQMGQMQDTQTDQTGVDQQIPDQQGQPDQMDQMGQLSMAQASIPPIPPTQRDPERFTIIKRYVPEIWYFAQTPSIDQPLADEKAWFYPKWKGWPFAPYFANFSTAPIEGDDRHLLVQGIVHGIKGAQQMHNSSETLMLLHLNGTANSGWLEEENSWLDPAMVQKFGASPNVNLSYKKGRPAPQRIFPMPLSTAHEKVAERSAEAIKAELGINADLLAVQDGGSASGRAIALRQRQGLLMVQKLFDNLSRTKIYAGKLLLSQLGEIYDTETAKKVLGEAFLAKNFPPPMEFVPDQMGNPAIDPMSGQPQQQPMVGQDGQPMTYDTEMAELAIAEVLSGELGQYDVAVGESVASETMKLANAAELSDLAAKMPGLIPPDLLIEESQLNQSTKSRILGSIKQAQAQAQQAAMIPQVHQSQAA